MSKPAAPRVIHVVESLDRNAVETWLLRMLRHARDTDTPADWTFFTILGHKGSAEDSATALGAEVIHSSVPMKQTSAFVRNLRRQLARGGYDVIHAHHDLLNSLYLIASVGTSISRRICHIHNADEGLPTPSAVKQWAYREPMRRTAIRLSDRVVGISNHTLDTFLKGRPRRAGRDVVHYYGIDSSPFSAVSNDSSWLRQELSIEADAPILLFASRLAPEKNPLFAVDVLRGLRASLPNAVGVFVGSGPLEDAVRSRAKELGVESAVRLAGWRSDLPRVLAAADCFILPRPDFPLEGFGLVVVEAQLAGLPMLLSAGIPDDSLLPTAVYRRLPTSAGAEQWASAAAELIRAGKPKAADAIEALAQSPMDMGFALKSLTALHSQ
ncbi:MAG TPA: glycosyltransferase [Gemmatimonadaceae bacterium]|nr:glycosyltransferase [Gemmatimonadaceae bacterium]